VIEILTHAVLVFVEKFTEFSLG